MLDSVYKLRYQKRQRRRWEAAAALRGEELSRWIRASLDGQAEEDILYPPVDE
jgi:hypothetical protein